MSYTIINLDQFVLEDKRDGTFHIRDGSGNRWTFDNTGTLTWPNGTDAVNSPASKPSTIAAGETLVVGSGDTFDLRLPTGETFAVDGTFKADSFVIGN